MVEASLEVLVLPPPSRCWDYKLVALPSAEVSLARCCLVAGAHTRCLASVERLLSERLGGPYVSKSPLIE